MILLAFALYVGALGFIFGVRAWVQRRRTGTSGFRGITGRPPEPEWIGGVLFLVAIAMGLAALLLALIGGVPTPAPIVVQVAGLVIAIAGFAAMLAGQLGMGASWRVGVDTSERTDLVTTGAFGWVRNPVFTAMVTAQAGIALMVPTWVSALALLALVGAVELQVRTVEEPYLRQTHGVAYENYGARVGRFVPGVGRLGGAAPTAHG